MTREEMMDTVIRTFGFEDERTIAFARVFEILDFEAVVELFHQLFSFSF